MQTLVLAGLVLGTTAFTVYLLVLGLSARGHDGRPRGLQRLFLRAGADMAQVRSRALAAKRERAERICWSCRKVARCRRWFDSGKVDGFQAFCPNTDFVESLRRRAG